MPRPTGGWSATAPRPRRSTGTQLGCKQQQQRRDPGPGVSPPRTATPSPALAGGSRRPARALRQRFYLSRLSPHGTNAPGPRDAARVRAVPPLTEPTAKGGGRAAPRGQPWPRQAARGSTAARPGGAGVPGRSCGHRGWRSGAPQSPPRGGRGRLPPAGTHRRAPGPPPTRDVLLVLRVVRQLPAGRRPPHTGRRQRSRPGPPRGPAAGAAAPRQDGGRRAPPTPRLRPPRPEPRPPRPKPRPLPPQTPPITFSSPARSRPKPAAALPEKPRILPKTSRPRARSTSPARGINNSPRRLFQQSKTVQNGHGAQSSSSSSSSSWLIWK